MINNNNDGRGVTIRRWIRGNQYPIIPAQKLRSLPMIVSMQREKIGTACGGGHRRRLRRRSPLDLSIIMN